MKLQNHIGTFTVVVEPDEDGYHGYVPALPGCHTFGLTIDETVNNLQEAMTLHIEAMIEDGEPIPIEHDPVFITRMAVPAPS